MREIYNKLRILSIIFVFVFSSLYIPFIAQETSDNATGFQDSDGGYFTTTSEWDEGTKNNTTTSTDRYNQTDNTLELDFPYADKDQNLLSYFRFENNVTDLTGNATITENLADYTSSGKFGGAYDFTASNGDDMTFAHNDDWNFTSDFTITFWLKGTGNTQYKRLFSKYEPGIKGFEITANEGNITMGVRSPSSGYLFVSSTSNKCDNDTWAFVACRRSDSYSFIYINGVEEVATLTTSGDLSSTALPRLCRHTSIDDTHNYDGIVDELKIYDTNLSTAKILELYNSGNRYKSEGNYTSKYIDLPSSKELNNISYAFNTVHANACIDKVEILYASNDTHISTATGDITSNSTISTSDFNQSFSLTSGQNITIKTYLKGNNTETPTLANISYTFCFLIPYINNTTASPTPQTYGGYVNVSADIEDSSGISSVYLNVSVPDGTYQNDSMTTGAANEYFRNTTYSYAGWYNYTIWAKNTNNAYNNTTGNFNITDAIKPLILNITAVPDPQEYDYNINISCDVVDVSNVSNVKLNITQPDNSTLNLTMSQGNNNKWYLLVSLSQVGNYTYIIWAKDIYNNLNYSTNQTFNITDNTIPEITEIQAIPNIQDYDYYVNISCNITDKSNISSVIINITKPDISYVNTTMINTTSPYWYYNQTYDIIGLYNYTIWVNDTYNNSNITGVYNFTVEDNISPLINSVQVIPSVANYNNYINISCNITDDYNISTTYLNITYPNTTTSNISMLNSGDIYYLNQTYSEVGQHNYTIWTKDIYNNCNTTSGYFTIQDNTKPEIANITAIPDPQEYNNYVNISTNIIDKSTVDAWLNVTYPSSATTNISMLHYSNDIYYYNTSYNVIGLYNYTIWAKDMYDNWNHSSVYNFTIEDTTPPIISNITDVPDPQINTGNVNITCDVIDISFIAGVKINITYPNATYSNISMIQGINNQWCYEAIFANGGIYNYTIYAKDIYNNLQTSSIYNFTIEEDTTPPILSNLIISSPIAYNTATNISITATDNIAIEGVWLDVVYTGGSYTNLPLIKYGDIYTIIRTYTVLGTYNITIRTKDTSNNWANDTSDFTVLDTTKPIISNFGMNNTFISAFIIEHDITFKCTIQDKQAVIAYINITSDNYTLNETMSYIGNSVYIYIISFNETGNYTYNIWAEDPSGNVNNLTGNFNLELFPSVGEIMMPVAIIVLTVGIISSAIMVFSKVSTSDFSTNTQKNNEE